jgi:hypothetical protein
MTQHSELSAMGAIISYWRFKARHAGLDPASTTWVPNQMIEDHPAARFAAIKYANWRNF